MNIHVFGDRGELKDAVLLMFRSEDRPWDEADRELARLFGADPEYNFSGKAGRTRLWSGAGGSCLFVGLGKADELDLDGFRAAVGTAVRAAASQEIPALAVASEHLDRLELGEELFWRGLREYTQANDGRSVVTADFQQAMERAAGRSLQGFFDAWVYGVGGELG